MATSTPKELENISLINNTYEQIWDKRNLSYIDQVFAPEALYHGPSMEFRGSEEFKSLLGAYFNALTETHFTVTNQIAKDDIVVSRFVLEGTHSGDMQGIPPTGKKVKVSGIEMNQFEHGKIVESWEEFDQLGLMSQLGMELHQAEATH